MAHRCDKEDRFTHLFELIEEIKNTQIEIKTDVKSLLEFKASTLGSKATVLVIGGGLLSVLALLCSCVALFK